MDAPSARLLIVDDDPAFLTIGRKTLQKAGFAVVGEAKSAAEGIQLASQHQPDLVLLDVNMPGMEGFDALAPLRRACPTGLVVFYSSSDRTSGAQRAASEGVAFLSKDTPLERWSQILQEMVNLHRRRQGRGSGDL